MASAILGAITPYAAKFAMKNAGKLIGSGVKWLKNSKYEMLNKVGEKVGSVINKVNNVATNNKLENTELGKQIKNATAPDEAKWNMNLSDEKQQQQQQLQQLPQQNAVIPATQQLQQYAARTGTSNFARFYRHGRHGNGFKRVNIKTPKYVKKKPKNLLKKK